MGLHHCAKMLEIGARGGEVPGDIRAVDDSESAVKSLTSSLVEHGS
jgi:hypothetical protein